MLENSLITFLHLSQCSFFSTLMSGVWPSGTMRPYGVYVCAGRRGWKTEGVWGRVAGERRRCSWRITGVAVAVRWSGGGSFWCFNRDVRHDKEGPDRPAEWSCRDRAALLSVPYMHLALRCIHSRRSLLSHSCHLSCCINLFLLQVTVLWVSLMCQSLMCVSTFMTRHSLKLHFQEVEGIRLRF